MPNRHRNGGYQFEPLWEPMPPGPPGPPGYSNQNPHYNWGPYPGLLDVPPNNYLPPPPGRNYPPPYFDQNNNPNIQNAFDQQAMFLHALRGNHANIENENHYGGNIEESVVNEMGLNFLGNSELNPQQNVAQNRRSPNSPQTQSQNARPAAQNGRSSTPQNGRNTPQNARNSPQSNHNNRNSPFQNSSNSSPNPPNTRSSESAGNGRTPSPTSTQQSQNGRNSPPQNEGSSELSEPNENGNNSSNSQNSSTPPNSPDNVTTNSAQTQNVTTTSTATETTPPAAENTTPPAAENTTPPPPTPLPPPTTPLPPTTPPTTTPPPPTTTTEYKLDLDLYDDECWDANHWSANLHCCICFEYFTEAKVLGCGHTFCQGCIDKLVKIEHAKNRQRIINSVPVNCPTCRHTMSYSQYAKHAPRNRVLETLTEAWKKSDDRRLLLTPKVDRGLQTEEKKEPEVIIPPPEVEEVGLQTDPEWKPEKLDFGQQARLTFHLKSEGNQTNIPLPCKTLGVQTHNPTRDCATETSCATKNKYCQTPRTKSCNASSQYKPPSKDWWDAASQYKPHSKDRWDVACQCDLPKKELKLVKRKTPLASPAKKSVGSMCVVETPKKERFTQTKEKNLKTITCQTDIENSSHLRAKKGDYIGPWVPCSKKTPKKTENEDAFLKYVVILALIFVCDWRHLVVFFVSDLPTILTEVGYTFYTIYMIGYMMYYVLPHGFWAVVYVLGCAIQRSSA